MLEPCSVFSCLWAVSNLAIVLLWLTAAVLLFVVSREYAAASTDVELLS
jgi:hypothetical protein